MSEQAWRLCEILDYGLEWARSMLRSNRMPVYDGVLNDEVIASVQHWDPSTKFAQDMIPAVIRVEDKE